MFTETVMLFLFPAAITVTVVNIYAGIMGIVTSYQSDLVEPLARIAVGAGAFLVFISPDSLWLLLEFLDI